MARPSKYNRPTPAQVKAFSERLVTARVASNLKQYELAIEVGVEKRTISQWEKCRVPNNTNAEKLAKVLNVSFNWLLHGRADKVLVDPLVPIEELAIIVREIEMARNALNRAMDKLATFNERQISRRG